MPTPFDFASMGRALNALRVQRAGTCAWCGGPFQGYESRRFCSDACRSAAFRQRRKEAEHKAELAERRRALEEAPVLRRRDAAPVLTEAGPDGGVYVKLSRRLLADLLSPPQLPPAIRAAADAAFGPALWPDETPADAPQATPGPA
jgi:hypothetical protein